MQPDRLFPVASSRQVTTGQPQPSQPSTTCPPIVGQVSAVGQQTVHQQPTQPSGPFPNVVRAPAQPFPAVIQVPPQIPQPMPQPRARQVRGIQQQGQGGGDPELMFPVAKNRS